MSSADNLQQAREDDATSSPVPPDWVRARALHDVLSVNPAVHARVRALPAYSGHESSNGDNQVDKDSDDDDDDIDDSLKVAAAADALSAGYSDNNTCSSDWVEQKASHPLVAPQPRHIVSPELIFSSAAESLSRHKRPCFGDARARHFRPIVAERSDVALTSPPTRAANPVVLDARFQQRMPPLALDDAAAPLQPFYSRTTRRFVPPHS